MPARMRQRERVVYCVTTMPAPTKPRHTLRWALLGVFAALSFFYVIGSHVQADASQVDSVSAACTAKADDLSADDAHHMTFNPCAELDTTQVQDRR